MRRLPLLVLVLATAGGAARGDEPSRPGTLAERFVEAWNTHAPKSFGIVLAVDADWVTASGIVLRGRADIEDYLAREHATWARETSMAAVAISSRAVAKDVVVVRLEWSITDSAQTRTERTFPGVTQFVAERTGQQWRVVSGQVTSGRGRARTN